MVFNNIFNSANVYITNQAAFVYYIKTKTTVVVIL